MANTFRLPCKSCHLQRHGVLIGLLHMLLARQTAVAMRVATDLTQLMEIAETVAEDALATFNVSISAVGARGASVSGVPPYHGPPLPSGFAQSDYRFHEPPEAMQESVVEIHRTPIEAKHRSSFLENTEQLLKGFIANHKLKAVNLEQGSLLLMGLLTGSFFFVSAFVVWTTLNRLSEEASPPKTPLSNDALIQRKADRYERSSTSRSTPSGGKAASEEEADDTQLQSGDLGGIQSSDLGEDSAQKDGSSLKTLGESCGTKLRKQLQSAKKNLTTGSPRQDFDIRRSRSMPAEILQYKYEPIDCSSEEDNSSDDDFSIAPGEYGDSGLDDENSEPEPEHPSDEQTRERSKTQVIKPKHKHRQTPTSSNKVPKPQKKMRSTWPDYDADQRESPLDLKEQKNLVPEKEG